MIKGSNELIDKCFNKPPQLLDLTQIDNERLKKHLWSGALLLSLKNIFEHDFLSFMEKDMTTIFQQLIAADGEPLLRNMLEYYVYKGNITNSEQFSNYIAQQIPKEIGEEMTTLVEQRFSDGMQQGLQQGEKRGVEKGLQQGEKRGIIKGIHQGMEKSALRIARNLLAQGLNPTKIAQVTELSVAVIFALQEEMQGVN